MDTVCLIWGLTPTYNVPTQDFLKQGETVSTRCDELQSLRTRGCEDDKIENPRGGQRILENKEVTSRNKGADELKPEDITQIQPQKLSLLLRSGEEQGDSGGEISLRYIVMIEHF